MMNEMQVNLYQDLHNLTQVNDAFYFKDQVLDGITYRVFSYRMASYTDFCMPGALECRGIMFEVNHIELKGTDDPNSEVLVMCVPIRLVAMPMSKFFNDGELAVTIGIESGIIDYNTIEEAMIKCDGSLMSTYHHGPDLTLRIKSKTALESDHAINAMRYLALPENVDYKKELDLLTVQLYTVNMEYTSPEPNMRIVIGYQEPRLTVLNIRSTSTGKYIRRSELDISVFPELHAHWVDTTEVEDGPAFIASIPSMVGIEGYVLRLTSGLLVKKKTAWYLALHHTKDSITNPRRLYECVLDEASDDLRALFKDDLYSLTAINNMELLVHGWYNQLVKVVESYYETNKHEDRKTYAVRGQKELDSKEFAIAMLKYQDKEFSYKTLMKKWWFEFGLVDSSSSELVVEGTSL